MSSPPSIEIAGLPPSIEEFRAQRDLVAWTPHGGAAMMVVALLAFAEGEELGKQCLAVAVDRSRLEEGPYGYRGWQLGARERNLISAQLRDHPYIPRSYIRSATPENGYQLPAPPYTIACAESPYSGHSGSGTYKALVVSSGADSPRPVRMERNTKGIWKAAEWSSLIMGVQPPARQVVDDL
jgi:hypothetical protein